MLAIIMKGYEMEIARQKKKLMDEGIEIKVFVESPIKQQKKILKYQERVYQLF